MFESKFNNKDSSLNMSQSQKNSFDDIYFKKKYIIYKNKYIKLRNNIDMIGAAAEAVSTNSTKKKNLKFSKKEQ